MREANQEIDYLTRLIDNLLDMSRIEAGAFVPRRECHVVEELIEAAIRQVGSTLRERPLEVNRDPDLPTVFVDGLAIQRVLVNLRDNAVKYSPPSSIIRCEVHAANGELRVSVTNDGEGIPTEDLDRIFDRFYRVSVRRARMVPGSGLGLAICKGIIEAHRGRIWANSRPSGQTTIAITLPVSHESAQDMASQPQLHEALAHEVPSEQSHERPREL